MKLDKVEILSNLRVDPNDFLSSIQCDYCNNYQSQIAKVPVGGGICHIFICKTCLTQLIEKMDRNMVINFETDFIRNRNHTY